VDCSFHNPSFIILTEERTQNSELSSQLGGISKRMQAPNSVMERRKRIVSRHVVRKRKAQSPPTRSVPAFS